MKIHIDVTVKNIGAGHAIQQGSTTFYDLVDVRCGEQQIFPIGGDIIDEIGGFLEKGEMTSHYIGI